jgi:hypothetical protein
MRWVHTRTRPTWRPDVRSNGPICAGPVRIRYSCAPAASPYRLGGRSGRTAVAALSAVVASLTLGSGPAFAHGGTTIPDAAYYCTELTAVTPQPAGVSARVDPGGEWVEVTNRGPAVVVVLGYLGEPYLRLGSGGVDENQVSPSTYLNRSLFADSVPSGDQAAGVAPVWRSTGSGASVQWHDHRIHWMGQARPPMVDKDPGAPARERHLGRARHRQRFPVRHPRHPALDR